MIQLGKHWSEEWRSPHIINLWLKAVLGFSSLGAGHLELLLLQLTPVLETQVLVGPMKSFETFRDKPLPLLFVVVSL